MKHIFRTIQWVPYPAAGVFRFFADPRNLPLLTPAWQQARVEDMNLLPPPNPEQDPARTHTAGAGSRITISFRAVPMLPIRMKWDAIIVDFEWNRTFADEQRPRGPFRYWHHRHTVTELFIGKMKGSQIEDELEYELPFGLLGDIADKLVIARQIQHIFAHRQQRLLELLSREGSPA
jgi:ligand-binding SRPBCC domain-containing protein